MTEHAQRLTMSAGVKVAGAGLGVRELSWAFRELAGRLRGRMSCRNTQEPRERGVDHRCSFQRL